MEPLNGELVPKPGASRKDLVESLQELRVRAGRPSLRDLEQWARTNGDHPLARTTVSEMLSGKRMPSQVVFLTFVRACGVSEGELGLWRQAWERVSLAETPSGNAVARLEHLRKQVSESEESLSRIIAGAERAAVESHVQLQKNLTQLETLIAEHQDRLLRADGQREESERSLMAALQKSEQDREESDRAFMAALQTGIRLLEDRHREAERVLEAKMHSIGQMLGEFEDRMGRLLTESAAQDRGSGAERGVWLPEDSSAWGGDDDLSPPVIN